MKLTDILDIKYPIIMAPMFLVSNNQMLIEASKSGITGAIPALNYRTIEELENAIIELKQKCEGPFGINLIVNKSNFLYEKQLEVCCRYKVDYIITSLGSPKETIKKAHKNGVKVFCDVTNLEYALKVEDLGADALIAVNSEAGGHAGTIKGNELISLLVQNCLIPVISAGGVGTKGEVVEKIKLGAAGVSVGSLFIACLESDVSDDYKEACVRYSENDIIMTDKLSGTPCTVIKTPYVEKIGTKQNYIERILNKNKWLKKWLKAITFYKGMKSLKKAAFSATYKSLWVAGPSIKHVEGILSVKQIVRNLTR